MIDWATTLLSTFVSGSCASFGHEVAVHVVADEGRSALKTGSDSLRMGLQGCVASVHEGSTSCGEQFALRRSLRAVLSWAIRPMTAAAP